jgi:hypothetical protein
MATLNPPSTQTSEKPSPGEAPGTEMTLLEHLGMK